jgi:hypothetical protein
MDMSCQFVEQCEVKWTTGELTFAFGRFFGIASNAAAKLTFFNAWTANLPVEG